MSSMIDYIGSIVTGGAIFLMMLSYYLNVSATAITQLFSSTTQGDMTSITQILESDFRKAGYGVTDSIAFSIADTNRIAIRGDMDNSGTIDTVVYWLGDTPMPGHPNPNARTLYRKSNGTTVSLTTNAITLFHVSYYDTSGRPAAGIRDIRFARVQLNMESKHSYDNQTAGEYWERVIKPQNVR